MGTGGGEEEEVEGEKYGGGIQVGGSMWILMCVHNGHEVLGAGEGGGSRGV